MQSYQSVIILKPDLDDKQLDLAVEKVNRHIGRGGGSVLKLEKWGKKRLAYRVNKNRFGFYLNICHTSDTLKVAAVENEYRLDEAILKYMIIRLEKEEEARLMAGDKPAETEKAADDDADDIMDEK